MNKRVFSLTAILLLVLVVILSGCSAEQVAQGVDISIQITPAAPSTAPDIDTPQIAGRPTGFDELVLDSDLSVAGTSSFTGAATFDGATTVNNTLNVTGTTTLDGASTVNNALTVTGVTTLPVNVELIGTASVITATVPYTPATGTVTTVADGEIWFVHKVFIRTDTNFDCTGDDCTLTLGDGNDPNGFISAADANIQTTFTEATGYAAGYFGIENGSGGAYTLDDGGPFVYAPSGSAETIDYVVGGTDPAAGSATVFLIYTRIK